MKVFTYYRVKRSLFESFVRIGHGEGIIVELQEDHQAKISFLEAFPLVAEARAHRLLAVALPLRLWVLASCGAQQPH